MTEKQLNEARQKIAEAIKARREELGLLQTDIAEKTGMGIATIRRFESGRFWLNLKQYVLLRNALDMSELK